MAAANITPNPPSNAAPLGICSIDPTSGLVYSPGCANYTPITTAGTTTLDSGGGIFYGFTAISAGTGFTIVPYDIFTSTVGTTTSTTTNQLYAIATAGGLTGTVNIAAGAAGVRYNNQLVIVTAGTPGSFNVLWD